MPNRTKLGFGSGIELALLVALGIAYVSPRGLQPQTASGSAYIPGTSIARRGADGVDVVMWDGGSLLLVEDYITRVGLEYDPVLQSYRELDAPDPAEGYALSMLPEGLSVDGDYLLFAGDDGDGFVDLHTGDVTRLSVPRTVQASPLMAFDPTVRLASVVISRSGEVNRLGAGELQELPVDLMVHDLDSQQQYEIETTSERLRNAIVAAAGETVLLLQQVSGVYKTYAVSVDGGVPWLVMDDAMEHTAIGAPRQQY